MAPEHLSAVAPAHLITVGPCYPAEAPSPSGRSRRHTRAAGAAAVELANGRTITTDTSVIGVFGNRYVAEVRPGEVGLYERRKGLQATVVLHKK